MGRKWVAASLLAGVLVVTLTGCGGDDDAADPADTTASTGLSSTSLVTTTVAGEGSAPGAGSQDGASATSLPTVPGDKDPLPTFTDFRVTADECPTADVAPDVSVTLPPFDGVVTVSWAVDTQPTELYTAVDNPDGAYEAGLPMSGSRTFTRQCGSAHTYYVVAVAENGQKVVKSQEVPAG